MKRALLCAMITLLGTVAGDANSARDLPRYDRALERAAARIVAAKMGELRAGFSFGHRLRLTPGASALPDTRHRQGPAATEVDDGVGGDLVPAVERPRSGMVF